MSETDYWTETQTTIDVSDSFPDCIQAERRGRQLLILNKLDCSIRRFDGKMAGYELVHRWLSCADEHCVEGQDITYYQKKEISLTDGLFDQFNLWG